MKSQSIKNRNNDIYTDTNKNNLEFCNNITMAKV